MSRVLALVGVALAIAGCVTVEPVQLPGGKAGYSLTCDSLAECMNEAAKHCGGSYHVIETATGTVMVGNIGAPYTELVFACGEAPPATNTAP
jgi:hypothetical protein